MGRKLDDSEIGLVRSGFSNAVIARQLLEPQAKDLVKHVSWQSQKHVQIDFAQALAV